MKQTETAPTAGTLDSRSPAGRGEGVPSAVRLRRCVACRQLAPKSSFWRIVRVYPSLAVQLDRGMGRSAYLCPRASCLQAAQRKDRLRRSLRTAVPPEIYQQLWERLAVNRDTTLEN